jgi:hypothetical protein
MNDRSVLIEMKKQHMLKLGLGAGYELPGWAEDMIDKAFQQPDFRAEVAAALDALRTAIDSNFDDDEQSIIFVLKELDAVIAKLGLKEKE